MPEAVFAAACREGSDEREARDILVSGAEIPLPDDRSFEDKDGHPRTVMRLKWWLCGEGPLPLETCARFAPDTKPTFFGHYWLTGMPPEPSSPTATCLDYSVARGGSLVAYRWDGELELGQEKFCYVSRASSDLVVSE